MTSENCGHCPQSRHCPSHLILKPASPRRYAKCDARGVTRSRSGASGNHCLSTSNILQLDERCRSPQQPAICETRQLDAVAQVRPSHPHRNNVTRYMMKSGRKPILIDGSTGEGGGQLIRLAVGLASLISQPIRIINIRQGRPGRGGKPMSFHVSLATGNS